MQFQRLAHLILRAACMSLLTLTTLAQYSSVSDLPTFSSNDNVDFYYCESSFPFNAPKNLVQAAGPSFVEYATSVSGLGVWDTTSGVKMTIQFVSNNYVGALLPVLSDNKVGNGGYLFWNNTGRIVVTNPLNTEGWTNSRHISTASGVAYADLVNYLQDNEDLFTTYQPVTIVQPTAEIVDFNSSAYSGNTNGGLGEVILPAQNSYSFVNELMLQLASYGVDLDTFLDTFDNSFSYLMANETELEVVEWEEGGLANEDVYNWFKDMIQCYRSAYDATLFSNGGGAQYFLQYLSQHCYNNSNGETVGSNGNGAYAYVYRSQNSVYNVSLMNFSSYSTPVLFRSVYTLPSTPNANKETLDAIDYIMIAAFVLFAIIGTYLFLLKFFSKSQRRRVSFEGERIAEKTVAAQTEMEQEHEANYYTSRDSYSQRHLIQSRNSTLQSLLNFGGVASSTSSVSRNDLNTRLNPSYTNSRLN